MTYNLELPGALVPYTTPRLIPHVIDDKAATNPDGEAFRYPRTSDARDGWEGVSWSRYANAVNHTARWLLDTLGVPAPGSFPTVAFIAQNDARYLVLVVATHKAGYKALLISPRNTAEAQLSLFEETKCDTLLIDRALSSLAQPWLAARPSMRAIEVAPFADWFPNKTVPYVPYTKTYEEAKWDPLVVMHTSGSTGIPKPVVGTHGMLGIADQLNDLPEYMGTMTFMRHFVDKTRKGIFGPMPLFHAAGLFFFFAATTYLDVPYALGMPDRFPTADLARECIAHAGVDAVLLPPSVLEQMSRVPEHVEALRALEVVCFGGGPLPSEAGDRLVQQGVQLVNCIGATEASPYIFYYQPNLDLWQYYIFNTKVLNIEWRRVLGSNDDDKSNNHSSANSDAAYQMVVRRRKPGGDPGYQAWFYTFPDADEFDTKDLFAPHPTLPDHWRYVGRGDDVVVFSNGEKLNPVTIEDLLMGHPDVRGALVVGAGKFQAGLLIEPSTFASLESDRSDGTSTAEQEAAAEQQQLFIDGIWPLVQRANEQTVRHGRIARDMIQLSRPDKPFCRAGKGTIQRAATARLYAAEIDEMYRQIDANDTSATRETEAAERGPAVDTSSEGALIETIQRIFADKVADSALCLDPDTNLFTAGVDSLMVATASRQLRAGMQAAGCRPVSGGKDALGPRAVYSNPTPRLLTGYILRSYTGAAAQTAKSDLNGGGSPKPDDLTESDNGARQTRGSDEEEDATLKTMQALLDKLTTNLLPSLHQNRPDPATRNQTVILTGSTGMLGGYILETLLANPDVGKVVCLNRVADGGRANYYERSRRLAKKRRHRGFGGHHHRLPPTTKKGPPITTDGGNRNDGDGDEDSYDDARLEFHHADAAHPYLGLPGATYLRLLSAADRVIHAAWPVNFNIPLSSFGPSLQGVRGIADLASRAEKKVVVVFVSSIASVQGYRGTTTHGTETTAGTVPETRLTDLRIAIPGGGYGQSKMLGSLVLDEAAVRGGFVAASVRVGQIAGSEGAAAVIAPRSSTDGCGDEGDDDDDDDGAVVWNRHEWLPSLIASSVYLGALPRTLGAMDRVDWTPAERIAGLIAEVAGLAGRGSADCSVDELGGYYHGVNPQATTWSGPLVQAVQEHHSIPRIVEFSEWVALLEESQRELEHVTDEAEMRRRMAANPGVKLLDMYRGALGGGQTVLEMTRTAARSCSMRTAGPVTAEMMRGWCRQWRFGRE